MRSWLRRLFIRWLHLPEVRTTITVKVDGPERPVLTADDWEKLASMFSLVPGLQDQLRASQDALLTKLLALPADAIHDRIRIELAAELRQVRVFLGLPDRAVAQLNQIFESQQQEQLGKRHAPAQVRNIQ